MLTQRVDLFDSTYGHFSADVLATIRRETFGEDIGQNSWLTVAPVAPGQLSHRRCDCAASRSGSVSCAPTQQ